MSQKLPGSFHLFRVAGIDLYLHWTWFAVAVFEIQSRSGRYSSIVWNVFEYLALFLIVLLHEFGHAFACRQVGGTANRIMLWPLGGVAYVSPPQRAGATLWSIVAGPLVNVALAPVFWFAYSFAKSHGWAQTMPDVYRFLWAILFIDILLLIFNLLPIYPLDGGQILRSLLWFVFGQARSLLFATVIGFVGVVAMIALAAVTHSFWYAIMAIFMLMSCWNGLKQARSMLKVAKLPRHARFACPSCGNPPPAGPLWVCAECTQKFDPFLTGGVCPLCASQSGDTQCPHCSRRASLQEWAGMPAAAKTEGVGQLP